ncbi:MAG TPA: biotin--[acetyl-CoA-carboxylase] ligase [Acidimicrobiales bacterium]|nr:biotin--[acetyl-CoA-carboxylase] ligase [Acidimicrobiales bacterium]
MSGEVFWEVRHFASLDSTNRYLLEEARSGAPEGVVAVAEYQTAGRGRLGRSWEAPPGSSLLASVLLRPVLPPVDLHLCPVVVALAAADACGTVAGVVPGLKWPNDLVVGGRKLAGVLAEADPGAAGGSPGSVAMVVGIGLNVEWPGPPEAEGTSLRELTGRSVDRSELLGELLAALGRRLPDLQDEQRRERLLAELVERCVTLGQRVRVQVATETIEGTATGITDSGHLQVETAGGVREVAAGDVVLVRPPGTGPREPLN